MSAWWWLLVTETCSKLHIIEYSVVFSLNDQFGYTATWQDGSYQKAKVVPVHIMRAYSGNRGTVSVIFNLSSRFRWTVNIMPQPLYPQERALVPIEKEARWAPGPVWMFVKRESLLSEFEHWIVQLVAKSGLHHPGY